VVLQNKITLEFKEWVNIHPEQQIRHKNLCSSPGLKLFNNFFVFQFFYFNIGVDLLDSSATQIGHMNYTAVIYCM
jgi:hypothetical protein